LLGGERRGQLVGFGLSIVGHDVLYC
jgi:hypothetical protein